MKDEDNAMDFFLSVEELPFLERFCDKMPGGFFIYKADDKEEIIFFNKAMLRIFACDTEEEFKELTHNSFQGIVHKDDYNDVKKSIDEQISASLYDLDYVEYRIMRKDGSIRYVEDYGHYITTKEYGGIYYVFIDDATERMNERMGQLERINGMLRDIRVREARYRSALLHNALVFFEVDLTKDKIIDSSIKEDGKNINVINDFKDISEFPTFSSFAEHWMKHIKESNAEDYREFFDIKRLIRSYEEGIPEQTFEAETSTSDGTKLLKFVVLLGKNELTNEIMALSMITDITESVVRHRRFQAALSEANAENVMNEIFLTDLYRQIHGPVDTIRSFTEMIEYNSSNESVLRYCMEKIGTSSKELMGIVNESVISRFKNEKMKAYSAKCNFDLLLNDVRHRFALSATVKDIRLEFNSNGIKHNNAYGDSVRIQEVLGQLLDNAIKYTPEGGNVTLTVSESVDPTGETGRYTFIVEDNGIGIGKEFIKSIFDPFKRENTENGGRGIGLTVVKQIVDMMKGEISCSSVKGKGTKFIVKLSLPLKLD